MHWPMNCDQRGEVGLEKVTNRFLEYPSHSGCLRIWVLLSDRKVGDGVWGWWSWNSDGWWCGWWMVKVSKSTR